MLKTMSNFTPAQDFASFQENKKAFLLAEEPKIRGGYIAPETVIGDDGRQRIMNTTDYPWQAICSLRITGSNGQTGIGSGWLINPTTVVTAGHCVFYKSMGGWADNIVVKPAQNGSQVPYGYKVSNKFSTLNKWQENTHPNYDFGCIHLDAPITQELGWFSLSYLKPEETLGHDVTVAGYPAVPGEGKEMYFQESNVLKIDDRRIYYEVDTFGGQSGSPVWVREGEDKVRVVGIHAYGVQGTPEEYLIEANSATYLYEDVIEQLQYWTTMA